MFQSPCALLTHRVCSTVSSTSLTPSHGVPPIHCVPFSKSGLSIISLLSSSILTRVYRSFSIPPIGPASFHLFPYTLRSSQTCPQITRSRCHLLHLSNYVPVHPVVNRVQIRGPMAGLFRRLSLTLTSSAQEHLLAESRSPHLSRALHRDESPITPLLYCTTHQLIRLPLLIALCQTIPTTSIGLRLRFSP